MNLAIAHDYLNQYGGAERVIEILHELYPDAPIYTSIYIPEKMPDSFRNMDIRISFMQKLPLIKKQFKYYLLLYPKAFESFNLEGYDIILSSSSAFAKGIIPGKGSCHICYCYTPTRFIWDYYNYVRKEKYLPIVFKLLPIAIKKLKIWDLKIINRINYFIAISDNIKEKIKRYYNRDSEVIYPPVDFNKFKVSDKIEDYFLIVSRLNSYKNIDLAVKTFSKLQINLKIVGEGPFRKELEKIASSCVEFQGKVSDEELVRLYGSCRALIFPGEEDFGIAPLEAQASGRPVIAYAKGGALETIVDGVTGLFFKENTVESMIEAVNNFIKIEDTFKQDTIRENALKFDKEIFKKNIDEFIKKRYQEFLENKKNQEKSFGENK
ncbi:MAG: glycosyltransferase [Actinobacteria bacterium]|nr:glycosyltransferase [Actinomycetota bacterium]